MMRRGIIGVAISISLTGCSDDWDRTKAFMRCGVKTMNQFKMGDEIWRDGRAMTFQKFCMGSAGYKFDHACGRRDNVFCYDKSWW